MIHLPDLTFISALLAGMLSSAHCMAMCGALSLAGHSSGSQQSSGLLLAIYHAGRLFSYSLIGGLAGATGGFLLAQTCSDEVIALWPRVAANIALIGIALAMLTGWSGMERFAQQFLPPWRRLMPVTQRLRQSSGLSARFTLGMLWGWIPCGLVYAVAATAAISGSAITGATLLLGFGIGTLPALLGGSLIFSKGTTKLTSLTTHRHTIAVSIMIISFWQLLPA